MLNIGYFADGIWSHNAFKIIANDPNMQICFICVRRGSDDKILAKFAADCGIELFRDCDINSPKFLAMITKFNCDIFVLMSFDQIFKPQIIDLAPLGAINKYLSLQVFNKCKKKRFIKPNSTTQINNDKMTIFSTNQNDTDDKRRDKYT